MSRGWNWDFEDDRRSRARADVPMPAVRPPEPAPAVRAPDPRVRPMDPQVRFRRRRAVLALALALVLVAVLVSLLGSSGHRAPAASGGGLAGAAAREGAAGASTSPTAGDPIKDVLAYTPFVAAGADSGRDIALTFDDGPGPYTPELLSVLERSHVPATFFAVGRMERYFGASTAREVRDGDVVGDHTESHMALATLSAREQHEQLFEAIARIEITGAPRPELFRPPYGSFNETTLRELRSLGLLMVLWSVDTNDYLAPGVSTIVERTLAGARPGAIVLMHDGGGNRSQTVAALPVIIGDLRARGYRLVTIPQLLHDDSPPAGQPIPHSLAGG